MSKIVADFSPYRGPNLPFTAGNDSGQIFGKFYYNI